MARPWAVASWVAVSSAAAFAIGRASREEEIERCQDGYLAARARLEYLRDVEYYRGREYRALARKHGASEAETRAIGEMKFSEIEVQKLNTNFF